MIAVLKSQGLEEQALEIIAGTWVEETEIYDINKIWVCSSGNLVTANRRSFRNFEAKLHKQHVAT